VAPDFRLIWIFLQAPESGATGPGKKTVDFTWNGHQDCLGNLQGLYSFEDNTFLNKLIERINKSDIVVFNSGLHDIYSKYFTPLEYERKLEHAISYLENHLSTNTKFIWRETVSQAFYYQCRNGGNPVVKIVNTIGNKIALRHGWNILQSFYRNYGFNTFATIKSGGHHCSNVFHDYHIDNIEAHGAVITNNCWLYVQDLFKTLKEILAE
jgi:hypothetical protein